jgi:cytochrome c peroxidase
MDAAQRRGEAVFQARGCANCHAGDQFTDGKFHVVGTANAGDDGAFEKTGDPAHRGAFRTAPLRNVALSNPYLHDGSAPTIAEAVARHAKVPAGDMAAIEAFLGALTDRAFVANEALSIPKAFCGKAR